MAYTVLEIRQRITAKVERMRSLQPKADEPIVQGRTRTGMKYSTAKSNPEGISEKEQKQREQQDTPVGRKYKARPRS